MGKFPCSCCLSVGKLLLTSPWQKAAVGSGFPSLSAEGPLHALASMPETPRGACSWWRVWHCQHPPLLPPTRCPRWAQCPGPPGQPGVTGANHVGWARTSWPCVGPLAGEDEVVLFYLSVQPPWQNCVWKAVIPLPRHSSCSEVGTCNACGREQPWAPSRAFGGMWTPTQMWSTQLTHILGAGQAQNTDVHHVSPFLGPAELNLRLTAWDICSLLLKWTQERVCPPLSSVREQLVTSKGCKQGEGVVGRVPLLSQQNIMLYK